MKQILNIFRKDLRRFWREIAVSMALLATYSWNDVRGWAGERNIAASGGGIAALVGYQVLSGLVATLLPIAWAFLIVRVVQGEALVGDRQFWITRPYEWKKLLAAKVLFVVLTINLPLLIADFCLLAKAGFPPTHYVAGLLWMQVLIGLFLILPTATLATVTASVVQVILAILVVALYMICIAWLASVIPSSNFSGPVDLLEFALLIATCLAVILWQYARRKTAASRWMIAGLALAVALIVAATPYSAIVNHEFPRIRPGDPLPVQLALLPADSSQAAESPDKEKKEKEVAIQLPLSTAGMAEDSIVVLSGVKVSLEAPNGLRWNSGWVSYGQTELFPDQSGTQVSFSLKKAFFEQVKSAPVRARISLALTEYRDKNRRDFVTPRGEFLMSDVGICSADTAYEREIHCRAPLRTPSSMLITSDLSTTTCPAREGESRAENREIVRNWYQNSDSGPAEFGISSVKNFGVYLWARNRNGARPVVAGICPGTPLLISNPEFVRRIGTELEINSLRLADYRLRQFSTGGDGFMFGVR
jgi:hypothetical protein